jgi:2-polyprenyl-3-methyl-5-hydroxy-6-metoxy-1,4-benzoquinol methylase
MRQAARHRLSERELHEYVAEVEGHDSQITGVVGYFYAMYRAEVLARVSGLRGRDILEVGCGEGMMFDGTGV